MKVYFVRHGETEGNVLKIGQTSTTPLTRTGLEQAKYVAKRFKTIQIDLIVSSPYTRASQTAEFIAKETGKPLRYLDALKEIKGPTIVEGMSYIHPDRINIDEKIKENIHNPEWRYEDAENFYDVKKRAETSIEYLENLNMENVCVVAHGIILRAIFFTMAFGGKYTHELYYPVEQFLYMSNTGITICEKKQGKKWRLITYNDFAHLGEV